jgi:hypothetical protein
MIVATHQPLFLPWTGFFAKAMKADCLVLLDRVQLPRGRGWMSRNRLKCQQGELWLAVPIRHKGKGFQLICDAEIAPGRDWRRKHRMSIEQWYANAPYLPDYISAIKTIYERDQDRLVEFNLDLIRLLQGKICPEAKIVLQSELGSEGRGTELILETCEELKATAYLTFPMAVKYLDTARLLRAGIEIVTVPFSAPVYPQLWGDFIPNLSALDLLLNCGSAAGRIVAGA